jgi:FAD dependent oxidoreductase
MDRRDLLKGSFAMGGLLGLSGRAAAQRGGASAPTTLPVEDIPPKLAPIRAHVDRLFDITVCLRPFRRKGPRLEIEQMGSTVVVHNYGHGGSGWSLSWGSANIAVQKAMSFSPKQIAVVGCGIIGLTSAITAQRAGAQVTIYTRELFSKTRSTRANGGWTPDSRISLGDAAGPQFGELWERMARYAWKTHRSYLGIPGDPVNFADRYGLSDNPPNPGGGRGGNANEDAEAAVRAQGNWVGQPNRNADFGRYSDRIRDLTGRGGVQLPEQYNPFPVRSATRSEGMFFNIPTYGHMLLADFYAAGGKVVIKEFHSPSEMTHLKEKVVINCPGYAAKDLWRDDDMVPVRGQIGWLLPQQEVNYGISYRGVQVLSKPDGIMVIALENGDLKGYNDGNEIVRRDESERAVGVLEELYSRMPVPKT